MMSTFCYGILITALMLFEHIDNMIIQIRYILKICKIQYFIDPDRIQVQVIIIMMYFFINIVI